MKLESINDSKFAKLIGRMQKKLVVSIVFVFMLALWATSFNAAPPPEQNADWEVNPPIAEKFWVQKLSTPLSNGNNILFKVKYSSADVYPSSINVYLGTSPITLYDNGTNGDITPNDGIFACYTKENISAFRSQIIALEKNLQSKGSFLSFIGHLGTEHTTIPHFDALGFDNFLEVEIDALLINGYDCGTALLKQNSLMITDLSVVEDPSRTYNIISGSGIVPNPTSLRVWSFGSMMKNMAGSNVSPKNFIKSFVNKWMTDQTVNGQLVPKRVDISLTGSSGILYYVIEPWLRKVYSNPTLRVTPTNWESLWNNCDESLLLQYAPFKLTAIVNRLDLRGSTAYAPSVSKAGETRFVFSLVAGYSETAGSPPYGLVAGKPPVNIDQISGAFQNFIDWKGMNVIFEYGNVQTNKCDLRNFAQAWLDLSSYTSFPDANFNADLEKLTNTVTALNASPSKPNGSALNRIRTNERILFPTDRTNGSWRASDWEFRQFEIDASTGLLKQVPLTNTPVNESNHSETLRIAGTTTATSPNAPYYSPYGTTNPKSDNLADWVFHSSIDKVRLYHGSHNLPLSYPTSTDYLLAGSGLVNAEYAHHWDIDWLNAVTPNYPGPAWSLTNNMYEKQMVQQLSLNTCQGCHNGENKTIFTQVMPLGYGETAKYWDPIPDYITGLVDIRFGGNAGTTGTSSNYPAPTNTGTATNPIGRYWVKVSAFLTGRNYTGIDGTSGTFQDDFVDPIDDAKDNTMDGLFYVYDPRNNGSSTYPLPQPPVWGYNDLERRKLELCKFVNQSCNPTLGSSLIIDFVLNLGFGKLTHD